MLSIVDEINKRLEGASAKEVVEFFLQEYKDKIALASSLGAEDQVLTDMIFNTDKEAKVFTLDTGRLHPETYDVMDETNLKYGVKLDVYFPRQEDVQNLYKSQGINGHFESIEKRKYCCAIRKIEPLKRALQGLDVWFTGLRRSQSVTREEMKLVEWDEGFGLIKVNPLIEWDEEDVWEFIKTNSVPYNKLHDKGFPSIGCAPCTRAIREGDDIRAGRWWWENPEHKECGLHKK